MFFSTQYKDQEVGLNPTITVYCGGATPITTQKTTFETVSTKNGCVKNENVAKGTCYPAF